MGDMIMKSELLDTVKNNITVLGGVRVDGDFYDSWSLKQLIEKNRILLKFIERELNDDDEDKIEKLFLLIHEIEQEIKYFIYKYIK
jgi:hypothetical protein